MKKTEQMKRNVCNGMQSTVPKVKASKSLSLSGKKMKHLLFEYYGTCNSEEGFRLLKDYATRQFNAFLWISLVTITALLLEKLFKLFSLWSKARRIAGPPCSSFFGHNHFGSRGNFIGEWSVIDALDFGFILCLFAGKAKDRL